jgi:TonB family protein
METLDLPQSASTDTEKELNLLLAEDPADDWRRHRTAALGSAGFHFVAILLLVFVRGPRYAPPPPERTFVQHLTPLYIPPELTQTAPNKKPPVKELSVESIAPRPVLKAPAPAPSVAKTAPVKGQPTPPAPPPQVAQTKPVPKEIEPPKIEAPAPSVQTAQLPKFGQLPPQPQQSPKLALEDVNRSAGTGTGQPSGLITVPNPSVQDAVRNLSRSGGVPGSQSITDAGVDEMGMGPGLNLPPSAGRPQSSLELKSDPMGVDFRPYMKQVIAAVRRNWFAVYPEAARLGQRGQVVLQFAIVKQGLVTKVVFSGQSGAKALDQSAVAAISASNPLPPLPAEFKGDRIVLQMTFMYNMQR